MYELNNNNNSRLPKILASVNNQTIAHRIILHIVNNNGEEVCTYVLILLLSLIYYEYLREDYIASSHQIFQKILNSKIKY
jgi:hypothetical protein